MFFADVFCPFSGIAGTRIEMEDFWLHKRQHTCNQNMKKPYYTSSNFGGT
jgi:hypothetical protein